MSNNLILILLVVGLLGILVGFGLGYGYAGSKLKKCRDACPSTAAGICGNNSGQCYKFELQKCRSDCAFIY